MIDAEGRVVIPGINDAHVHAGAMPPSVTLEGPPAVEQDPSLDEILVRLKAAVAKAPKGGWIYGEIGGRVLDDQKATRSTLDAIAPDHPVMLTAWTGHGTLFNTAALRRLQVRDDEPDPPGGFFVRTAGTRTVTGLAHEYAEYIVRRRLSTMPDEEAQAKALRDYAAAAVGLGITSAQVMGDQPAGRRPRADRCGLGPADPAPHHRLPDDGNDSLASTGERFGPGLSARDGVGHQMDPRRHADRTVDAAARALRRQSGDTRAAQLSASRSLRRSSSVALGRREQPMFHAVGDAAIDDVLTALEQSGGDAWQPLRPRIEHGDMLEPPQFERAKRLGVTIVQNPVALHDPGRDGSARRSSHRPNDDDEKHDRGGCAGGARVRRADESVPERDVCVDQREQPCAGDDAGAGDHRLYVRLGAGGDDGEPEGHDLAGMLADLAMLSQDIFTVPPAALPATVSVLTLVGGRVVHERK